MLILLNFAWAWCLHVGRKFPGTSKWFLQLSNVSFTWNVNWKSRHQSIVCVCRLSITWGDKMGLYFCLDLSKLTNLLLPVILIGRVMKYTKKMNRWKKSFLKKKSFNPISFFSKIINPLQRCKWTIGKSLFLRHILRHLVFRTLN